MGRWYFGGLASAGAACCTHPLDLIKVGLFYLLITFDFYLCLAEIALQLLPPFAFRSSCRQRRMET